MKHFSDRLAKLKSEHRFRTLSRIDSPQGRILNFEGKNYLNFASNNYLGLACHPALSEAMKRSLRNYGVGAGASRLINGSMTPHHHLEKKLAEFKGTEAALLFNSGYHANLGALSCLLGEGDVIFSDELNHASMIDGMRLSKAEKIIYPHHDMSDLREKLKNKRSSSKGNFLIATESVFSMDGDLAKLSELAELAMEFDALLYVDEAHATGVFGENGAGLCESLRHHAVFPRLIQMGTLGKALGCFGAYIAASKEIIDFLINFSRPFIYTTALPPALAEAASAALEMVRTQAQLRRELWQRIELFRRLMQKLFPKLTSSIESPIIPIIIGEAEQTLDLSQRLKEAGFWISAIRPPTVAEGSSRLRITLMATHHEEDLENLVMALQKNLK